MRLTVHVDPCTTDLFVVERADCSDTRQSEYEGSQEHMENDHEIIKRVEDGTPRFEP